MNVMFLKFPEISLQNCWSELVEIVLADVGGAPAKEQIADASVENVSYLKYPLLSLGLLHGLGRRWSACENENEADKNALSKICWQFNVSKSHTREYIHLCQIPRYI